MDDSPGYRYWKHFDSEAFRTGSRGCNDDCRTLSTSRSSNVLLQFLSVLKYTPGLPAGVLNVVHGGVPTVNAICDAPAIKAISFVGGDRAGRHIYERFAFWFICCPDANQSTEVPRMASEFK